MIKLKQDPRRIQVLFQHIQKTAGTSVVKIATSHFGNSNCCSHGDYGGKRPEELAGIQFVSGHFGFDYAQHLMQNRYSFTFMRDPIERILSLYYFYRSSKPDIFPMYRIAHDNELTDFLKMGMKDPTVKSRIWNNQVWQLACGYGNLKKRGISSFSSGELIDLAKAHLAEFSFVGFTESFDQDISEVARDLGIVLPKKKVRSNSTKRPMASELNDEERSLLAELTDLDQQLYDFASGRKTVVSEKRS